VVSFRSFGQFSIVMATLIAWPALAQPALETPARIGNIWGGRAHEPDPSSVENDLKAKGFARRPQTDKIATNEVEDLFQRLMRAEDRRDLRTASRAPRTAGDPQPGRSGAY
jgi:hypothetical protein